MANLWRLLPIVLLGLVAFSLRDRYGMPYFDILPHLPYIVIAVLLTLSIQIYVWVRRSRARKLRQMRGY